MDARVPFVKTTSVFSERTVQSVQKPVMDFMIVKPLGSIFRGFVARLSLCPCAPPAAIAALSWDAV